MRPSVLLHAVMARGTVALSAATLALGLIVLSLAFAVSAAHADDSLVLSSADFATLGFHPERAPAGSARSQLLAGLARNSRTAIDLGTEQASTAGRHAETLGSDAFLVRSGAVAGRILASWRTTHRAARVRVGAGAGAGGAISMRRSRRGAMVQVLWRDGARLGLISLRAAGGVRNPRGLAVSYADLADSFLGTALPTTALAKVTDQIRPDGTVSEQTALQTFALAYGPLPGVHSPRGPIGQIPDGTMAADWILAYRSRLSPRRLRIVDRLLGVPPPGANAHATKTLSLYDDPGFRISAKLDAIADHWVEVYDGLLHLDLPHSMAVVAGYTTTLIKNSVLGGFAPADTVSFAEDGSYGSGLPRICRIRVGPIGKSYASDVRTAILAHEVFHCFEDYLLGTRVWNTFSPDPWIIEGLAAWAQDTVDPAVHYELPKLIEYLRSPAKPLFTRSYDANGFWGHVQDTLTNAGDSLWNRIPKILSTGDNEKSFLFAGADTPSFLNSWGSSVFNEDPSEIQAWRVISPDNHPPVLASPKPLYPGAGAGAKVVAAPYTTAQYTVRPTDLPLLHVQISGYARLDRVQNFLDLGDAWFCTSSHGCRCPHGTAGTVPPTQPLSLPTSLGVSGEPESGAQGTLTAVSLGTFCKHQSATGGSGGDPELFDFDGGEYDFQGAGEFTLLGSTRDDLQVQVRQQPFPGSRYVAENTAVAMRVGSDTVEVDSAGKAAIAVYVNKRRLNAPIDSLKRVRLGRGRLIVNGASAVVDWPDGSSVDVFSWLADANGQGIETPSGDRLVPALNLAVSLTADRWRHVDGLLGNWGAAAAREFVGRDGRAYPQAVITAGGEDEASGNDLRVLYDEFGASWRITQRQSLFHYPRGKSTRSYTIRGFPRRYLTAAALTAKQRAKALVVCQAAGVTNQEMLNACELDVSASGDKAFAVGDSRLQRAAGLPSGKSGAPGIPTSKLMPIELGSGSGQPVVAYDPVSQDTYVAWVDNSSDSIDLCAVTVATRACNAGSGPYHLVDPLASSGGYGPLYSDVRLVLVPGGDVIVLAEAGGANPSVYPAGYGAEGVVAWSSPPGGGAFAAGAQGIADGGRLLAPSPGDAPSGGAIALDATDIGVYGDSALDNGFTDFTLSSAAPPTTAVADSTGDYPDPLGNTGEQLASVPDPAAPGRYIVVAVGAVFHTPAACPAGTASATGYGVGVGTPAALRSQAAWSTNYFAPISCQADDPVLAGGGPDGGTIGLLEEEGPLLTSSDSGSEGIYYRRFETSTNSFGAPVLVSRESTRTVQGPNDLDLSQDSGGRAYATWFDSRGLVLSYSSNGGASWPTPRAIALTSEPNDDVIVVGAGAGAAKLAYTADNGAATDEYLLPITYSELSGG